MPPPKKINNTDISKSINIKPKTRNDLYCFLNKILKICFLKMFYDSNEIIDSNYFNLINLITFDRFFIMK